MQTAKPLIIPPTNLETTDSEIREKIYFSNNFSDIYQELLNRSKLTNIDREIVNYWGKYNMPYINLLSHGPYAVLSRSIATPNKEQLRFINVAKKYGLKPIIFEYNSKFVTINLEKLSLCKIHFESSIDKKLTEKEALKIADINYWQGKNMSQMKTFDGHLLTDFHHDIFWKYNSSKTCSVYNFTNWFNITRNIGHNYYSFFLSLFLKNAILFENYVLEDKSERQFVREKVLQSVTDITNEFQMKPLIFPFLPFENEGSIDWLSYPKETLENFKTAAIIK